VSWPSSFCSYHTKEWKKDDKKKILHTSSNTTDDDEKEEEEEENVVTFGFPVPFDASKLSPYRLADGTWPSTSRPFFHVQGKVLDNLAGKINYST